MRRSGLFVAFLLMAFSSISQDFSNRGREFWIPYSYHVAMRGAATNLSMTLYITSDVTTTYKVEIYGGAVIQTGTLNAGQVVTCKIGNTNMLTSGGLFSGKTVHVEADNNIAVYSYITQFAVSGATVCLPTNVLGKEYTSMNYTQISNETASNSYFTIIAVEDNTTVEIIPSATTTLNWAPGSVNTVQLKKGEIYQVLGRVQSTATGGLWYGEDLTGSKIRSISSGTEGCKRIAVFSGTGKIRIGASCNPGGTSSDNLYQQLYPVASWGKNYLTVPSYNRVTNFFRIIKSVPTARVFLNGSEIPAGSFVNGVYHEFSNTLPNSITSDEPISVAQYFTTQGCSGNANPYDPDMIILNPVEQNISNVTLVSSNLVATPVSNHQHHIHVIMPKGGTGISSFKFDGNPISIGSWDNHPNNPDYAYLYLNNVQQGYHTLSSDSGFNALAYGYAGAESYGYSAGANVKDLYQFVTLQNANASVRFPTTCRNTPFKLSMTFPYQPTKIRWVFGTNLNNLGFADTTLDAPVFDSTYLIEGKPVYEYRLPRLYSIAVANRYTVRVLATNPTSDGCGGEQEVTLDMEVQPTPPADFTGAEVCEGLPTQFIDQSTPGSGRTILKSFWDFGNGQNAEGTNAELTYADSGNYTVRHHYITDIGCVSDTATKIIRVKPLPTATISGTDSVCLNDPAPLITFAGDYGAAPFTFTYSINGGAPATATSISGNIATVPVSTSSAGVYTYTLLNVKEGSTNACAQDQTGEAALTVLTKPVASISGSTSVCATATEPLVTFTGTEGKLPYTFTYTINGGAPQTVITTSGNTVTVPAPTTTAGTFTYELVSVSDGNGTQCIQPASGSAVIIVNPLPTATISGATSVCKNTAEPRVLFTGANATAPYTFTYRINGGSTLSVTTVTGDTVSIAAPTGTVGDFVYELISVTESSSTTCGQNQSGSVTVKIWPLPVADYSTNNPVCETGVIRFTDKSVANSASLSSWSWDFADPSSGSENLSVLTDPTHAFATAGSYPIKLVVTNSNGCLSDNAVPALTVHPKPLAGYIIPEVCLKDSYAEFLDTTKVAAPSTITAWSWDFGDANWNQAPVSPNTSSDQNARHSYKAVGDYNVLLIVTSNEGCRDTIEQKLTVNGSFPQAAFTVQNPSSLCANDSVAIIDGSTVFPGVVTRVEIWWDDLGDRTAKTIDNLPNLGKQYKHLYPNFQSPLLKTFQIRLRAYSGSICLNETTQTITVNAAPKVQFNNMPAICYDAAPYQIVEATEVGAVPGTFLFRGPGVSTTGLFNPAIAGEGTHTIKYVFLSDKGCADSLTQTIKVWTRALADFQVTSSPVCEKQAVTFTDVSTSAEGTITEWIWDFGDGSPVENRTSNAAFTHTFPQFGTYTVTLTVITDNGCVSAAKTMQVNVEPLARPNFTFPSISCLPNAVVQFTNASTVPGSPASTLTYTWDFGDPGSGASNQSGIADPAHTYTTLGPFNVKLTATTAAGCVHDTTIVLNTLHPEPVGAFVTNPDEVCVGSPIQFTNTSDPADGTLQSLAWDMGDGTTRNSESFTYTYARTGNYTVNLTITNSLGCKSSVATKLISINPYPVVDAGPNRVVLEGGFITINATATNANGLAYLWSPATGLNDPTLLTPVASPVVDTRYLLRVTSDKGCADTSSMFLKVLFKPVVPNTITPNGDGINDKWDILYIDSYPGSVIEVYTATGQLVFRSTGYNNPWDGTNNGKSLPSGTYYYVIDPKNGRAKMAGYVTILR
jgi:gliding motility-associated-like protein